MLIIGAGMAGLSAGCYAQMNGYTSQLFEMHTQPGGLCTAWKRKGYTVDGCIHWLVGSKSGTPFYRLWEEVGAVQGRTMINHEEFMRVEGEGKTFIVYTNLDRLEKHMLELAPGDAAPIRDFIAAARVCARNEMPIDPPGPLAMLVRLPGLWVMLQVTRKYGTITIETLADRFSDPFLRRALKAVFDIPGMAASGILMTLAWMHNQDAGYPIGGSLPFAQAVAQRYQALGGQLHYQARVKKILVKNDCAVGLQLADGTEHYADIIVSAADGHATIFDMLEGKYADEETRRPYKDWPIFQPVIMVSLGVARDLAGQPHMVTQLLEQPLTLAGEPRHTLGCKHYHYDPTLAPAGKEVIEVMLPSTYAYWQALAADSERYEAEKKQIALTVIAALEKRLPGLTQQVEMVDVATPLTFEHYTGNWQGSFEGWLLTPAQMQNMLTGKSMRKTLPGLKNFYMVGQWVEPGGGLPGGLTSGRSLIKTLCQQARKPFVTTTP